MNTKTLFLAWQDPKKRLWFPIGRLDVDESTTPYCFRYVRGAKRAREEAKFPLLAEFPHMEKKYRSGSLFALFGNRVIARGRPDRADHLCDLGLEENADPIEILSVNGGRRVTDAYQVFPKLMRDDNGRFGCRFFLHGWRYMQSAARDRIGTLEKDEVLRIGIELNNPATGRAVQVQTEDHYVIGWAPRWLIQDVMAAAHETGECSAHVVQVNPLPVPSQQRVLIEMRGRWSAHEPMVDGDFVPLVGD